MEGFHREMNINKNKNDKKADTTILAVTENVTSCGFTLNDCFFLMLFAMLPHPPNACCSWRGKIGHYSAGLEAD